MLTVNIHGPQGAGKTTLMNIIGTTLRNAGIQVTCIDGGQEVKPERVFDPDICPVDVVVIGPGEQLSSTGTGRKSVRVAHNNEDR